MKSITKNIAYEFQNNLRLDLYGNYEKNSKIGGGLVPMLPGKNILAPVFENYTKNIFSRPALLEPLTLLH